MKSRASPLPNFFLAGAPKAGTTSLYFYLAQHPEVYMSPVKEPTYFAAADLLSGPFGAHVRRDLERNRPAVRRYLDGPRPLGAMHLVLEWDTYQELFRRVTNEVAIGEASVRYFRLPSAARAIHETLPDARLIFVLRDPAEQLFARHLELPWHAPRPTFRERFLAGLVPGNVWSHGIEGGQYATHLQRFFDLFPRHQLRIYLYEEYTADPKAALRDMFGFLGVDPEYPIDVSRRHNESVVARNRLLFALRHRVLGDSPSPRWIPEPIRRLVRRAYTGPRPRATMDPDDRRLVIDHYRDEILRTGELIGRDLSAWLR